MKWILLIMVAMWARDTRRWREVDYMAYHIQIPEDTRYITERTICIKALFNLIINSFNQGVLCAVVFCVEALVAPQGWEGAKKSILFVAGVIEGRLHHVDAVIQDHFNFRGQFEMAPRMETRLYWQFFISSEDIGRMRDEEGIRERNGSVDPGSISDYCIHLFYLYPIVLIVFGLMAHR